MRASDECAQVPGLEIDEWFAVAEAHAFRGKDLAKERCAFLCRQFGWPERLVPQLSKSHDRYCPFLPRATLRFAKYVADDAFLHQCLGILTCRLRSSSSSSSSSSAFSCFFRARAAHDALFFKQGQKKSDTGVETRLKHCSHGSPTAPFLFYLPPAMRLCTRFAAA